MQANTNSSTPQLSTFILPAMGCHVQISLNITQLSLQQTQGNTDPEIDQKIDQKVALVKAYVEEIILKEKEHFMYNHCISEKDLLMQITRIVSRMRIDLRI